MFLEDVLSANSYLFYIILAKFLWLNAYSSGGPNRGLNYYFSQFSGFLNLILILDSF